MWILSRVRQNLGFEIEPKSAMIEYSILECCQKREWKSNLFYSDHMQKAFVSWVKKVPAIMAGFIRRIVELNEMTMFWTASATSSSSASEQDSDFEVVGDCLNVLFLQSELRRFQEEWFVEQHSGGLQTKHVFEEKVNRKLYELSRARQLSTKLASELKAAGTLLCVIMLAGEARKLDIAPCRVIAVL